MRVEKDGLMHIVCIPVSNECYLVSLFNACEYGSPNIF